LNPVADSPLCSFNDGLNHAYTCSADRAYLETHFVLYDDWHGPRNSNKADGKLSAIAAATKVLAEAGETMTCKQMNDSGTLLRYQPSGGA
jgi:hypothetical protein